MSKIQRMSDAEKQIMELIWAAERPVLSREIIENLPEDKHWKKSTVITFLRRLMDKGMVKATRVGKANHYEPCITEQEYKDFETEQFIQDVHKGSVLGLLTTLCDSGSLTDNDIEELMEILRE